MLRRPLLLSAMLGFLLPGAARATSEEAPQEGGSYDLIVVGAGGAGLSAAVSAAQAGVKRILILEKSKFIGGHTIISEGTFNALLDPKDRKLRNEWLKETMGPGNPYPKAEVIEKIIDYSFPVKEWMHEMGVSWISEPFAATSSPLAVSWNTGSERCADEYIRILRKKARTLGAKILFNSRAVKIETDSKGRVYGVVVQKGKNLISYEAPAVILATGGFTANLAMRLMYDPRLTGAIRSTANPTGDSYDGSTGDGIRMGQELGAQTVDMGYFELIPLQGGRSVNYNGADIYVNSEGKRFINESLPMAKISDAVLDLPDQTMWAITDSRSKKSSAFENKLLQGVIQSADSVQQMANKMDVPFYVLKNTLDTYNRYVEAGKDEEFGKEPLLQKISEPPFYFGREHFDLHTSMGGLAINEKTEVLHESGESIPGLFAAGETVGGISGRYRMPGNALTATFVLGYLAGKEAAAYLKKDQ